MYLPDGPPGGGLAAGDLPQRDVVALARALGDLQRDRGVGQLVLVAAAAVIGAGDRGERRAGQVSDRAFAVGEQVEPGAGDVFEQRR